MLYSKLRLGVNPGRITEGLLGPNVFPVNLSGHCGGFGSKSNMLVMLHLVTDGVL